MWDQYFYKIKKWKMLEAAADGATTAGARRQARAGARRLPSSL
jgi:hypothetical protein